MLSIERLVVRYGSIEAVRGVSISVNAGETVALIGANGAGKTTTLLAVSGVLAATSGTIRLDGQALSGLPPHRIVRRGVSQVLEGRGVFGRLTVRENLLAGAYGRRDSAGVTSDLERMFSRFPRLQERIEQPGYTLSGGEQQILVIARALMSRPRILLLDEPSMGLAPLIAEALFKLLGELKSGGLTMLLVEQNAAQALALADRAYVMGRGLIVAEGDSDSLLRSEDIRTAYLGTL